MKFLKSQYISSDLFGTTFTLENHDSSRHKTLDGAICTTIYLVLTIILSILISKEFIKRDKPDISISTISKSGADVDLFNFPIVFGLLNVDNTKFYSDINRYITVNVTKLTIMSDTDIQYSVDSFPINNCKSVPNYLDKTPLELDIESGNYLCVTIPENGKNIISNDIYTANSTIYNINFFRCNEKDYKVPGHCAPNVDEVINRSSLMTTMINAIIDPLNKTDTIIYKTYNTFTRLSTFLIKNINLIINKNEFSKDEGWLVEDITTTTYFNIQHKEADVSYNADPNDTFLLSIILSSSSTIDRMNLAYIKLPELFSQIGGVAIAFYLIILIFTNHYMRFKYLLYLFKHLVELADSDNNYNKANSYVSNVNKNSTNQLNSNLLTTNLNIMNKDSLLRSSVRRQSILQKIMVLEQSKNHYFNSNPNYKKVSSLSNNNINNFNSQSNQNNLNNYNNFYHSSNSSNSNSNSNIRFNFVRDNSDNDGHKTNNDNDIKANNAETNFQFSTNSKEDTFNINNINKESAKFPSNSNRSGEIKICESNEDVNLGTEGLLNPKDQILGGDTYYYNNIRVISSLSDKSKSSNVPEKANKSKEAVNSNFLSVNNKVDTIKQYTFNENCNDSNSSVSKRNVVGVNESNNIGVIKKSSNSKASYLSLKHKDRKDLDNTYQLKNYYNDSNIIESNTNNNKDLNININNNTNNNNIIDFNNVNLNNDSDKIKEVKDSAKNSLNNYTNNDANPLNSLIKFQIKNNIISPNNIPINNINNNNNNSNSNNNNSYNNEVLQENSPIVSHLNNNSNFNKINTIKNINAINNLNLNSPFNKINTASAKHKSTGLKENIEYYKKRLPYFSYLKYIISFILCDNSQEYYEDVLKVSKKVMSLSTYLKTIIYVNKHHSVADFSDENNINPNSENSA